VRFIVVQGAAANDAHLALGEAGAAIALTPSGAIALDAVANVVRMRAWAKVGGVAAEFVVAGVAYHRPVIDRPVGDAVCGPVSFLASLVREPKLAAAVLRAIAPRPALIAAPNFHARPEAREVEGV
jgi:hypothetical protein